MVWPHDDLRGPIGVRRAFANKGIAKEASFCKDLNSQALDVDEMEHSSIFLLVPQKS